jgi:hypothetical protein
VLPANQNLSMITVDVPAATPAGDYEFLLENTYGTGSISVPFTVTAAP